MAEKSKQGAPTLQRPRIGEWRESGGRLELLASRCTACSETFFPARQRCLRCRSEDLERIALHGPARLTNFTVIHQVPVGFASPLVAGYAEFEPGVAVFAPIDGDGSGLRAGTTLVDVYLGVIRSEANGEPLTAYRFRTAPRQAPEHEVAS